MPPPYESQVQPGQGTQFQVGIEAAPRLPGLTAQGEGLQQLGTATSALAQVMQASRDQTEELKFKTNFLTGLQGEAEKAQNSTDYANAPKNFGEAALKLKNDELGKITNPSKREELVFFAQQHTLSGQKNVNTAQLANQNNVQLASLNELGNAAVKEAADAGSPIERQAAIDRHNTSIDGAMKNGVISATDAYSKKTQLLNGLDRLTVTKDGTKDPQGTLERLRTDKSYAASLSPEVRQEYDQVLSGKADQNTKDKLENLARFQPNSAIAASGRVADPSQIEKVFSQGIVKIESNGNPNAVNPKSGATGLSQLMLPTARDVLKEFGMVDVAALPDDALRERLKSDPALNYKIGLTYFKQRVALYDGNIALGAAAYNAGHTRANVWRDEAKKLYGENFTVAQLQSVIPDKFIETRDYITKLGKALGAPLGSATFNSAHAGYTASTAVFAVTQQQETKDKQSAAALATAYDKNNPVPELMRQGFDISPIKREEYRQAQTTAAALGDVDSGNRVRELNTQERQKPHIDAAWQMSPNMLDTAVKNMKSDMMMPGADPTQNDVSMLHAYEAVQSEISKKRTTEPILLGGDTGAKLYKLSPLNINDNPNSEKFQSVLAERNIQANLAQQRVGGSGSPFTAEEVLGLKQRLDTGPTLDKFNMLRNFASNFSPQTYQAATRALNLDTPTHSVAAGLADQAPETAMAILEGEKLIKRDDRYTPSKGINKTAFVQDMDRVLPVTAFEARSGRMDDNGAYAALNKSIEALYAYKSMMVNDSTGASNATRLKQAADEITGGVLYHNGGPVIAPQRGMSQSRFDATLRTLTPDDLAGAQTAGGHKITPDYLLGASKLHLASQGVYYVQTNLDNANPQYALNASGQPFKLDLRSKKIEEPPIPNADYIYTGGL